MAAVTLSDSINFSSHPHALITRYLSFSANSNRKVFELEIIFVYFHSYHLLECFADIMWVGWLVSLNSLISVFFSGRAIKFDFLLSPSDNKNKFLLLSEVKAARSLKTIGKEKFKVKCH
jgi:hypothetical protein